MACFYAHADHWDEPVSAGEHPLSPAGVARKGEQQASGVDTQQEDTGFLRGWQSPCPSSFWCPRHGKLATEQGLEASGGCLGGMNSLT